ncbi:MAG: hypothetical protein NUV81_04180 [bacterium]|nr:hypothetical protein [bacterium]
MPDRSGELSQQNIQATRQLNSLRFRDNRTRARAESNGLRETGITEGQRPSPLDLPKESYTSNTDEGVPSRIAEIERQRASQQRMKDVASEFVGGPSTPDAGRDVEEAQKKQRNFSNNPESRDPARTDEERGARLYADQGAERNNQKINDLRQQLSVLAQKQSTLETSTGNKMLFHLIEGVLGGTSFTFITPIILLVIMNMQMINSFVFENYKFLPKPSLLKIALTILLDILALAVILILGLVIYYLLGAIVTVLKNVFKA